MIDRGKGPSPVMSEASITWTHRNFCERLPAEMLMVENPESGRKITMVPGVLRSEHVRVGRHVAPDPVDLPAFIKRFAEGYTSPNLSRLRKIVGVAASHHRLAWIPPLWTATAALRDCSRTRCCANWMWDQSSGRFRVALREVSKTTRPSCRPRTSRALSVEVGGWPSPRLACDLRCWARFSLHVVASTGRSHGALGEPLRLTITAPLLRSEGHEGSAGAGCGAIWGDPVMWVRFAFGLCIRSGGSGQVELSGLTNVCF